jgi:hypothetical protein
MNPSRFIVVVAAFLAAGPRHVSGQDPPPPDDEGRPYPVLITARTRADRAALAELERPGKVLFEDGFESADALARYFEVRGGGDEGRARVVTGKEAAHAGAGALRLTAKENGGKASGAGVSFWFGPEGHDRVHLRAWMRFAAGYDQGHLNHTGPGLSGVAGDDRWRGMGGAGIRPKGDDHFSTRLETWRDWGRIESPGFLQLYTYWMDMKRDRDGNFWGNMLGAAPEERVVPPRDRWTCLELMVRANSPGKADGELAAWADGRLYAHWKGLRWRSTPEVRLKRFGLDVYVHKAERDNTVWFDDVVLSTGYVGPGR